MEIHPFEPAADSRLNSISEELYAINAEILANLGELPKRTELVERLIARCDQIALELDAVRLEIIYRTNGALPVQKQSPEPSSNGSGLMP